MIDQANEPCALVSAGKLEKDMGFSKSYRQSMTKKGLFEAIRIPGQKKVFYNSCQVQEAILSAAKKPESPSPGSTNEAA